MASVKWFNGKFKSVILTNAMHDFCTFYARPICYPLTWKVMCMRLLGFASL